jgi:hypothetical protein
LAASQSQTLDETGQANHGISTGVLKHMLHNTGHLHGVVTGLGAGANLRGGARDNEPEKFVVSVIGALRGPDVNDRVDVAFFEELAKDPRGYATRTAFLPEATLIDMTSIVGQIAPCRRVNLCRRRKKIRPQLVLVWVSIGKRAHHGSRGLAPAKARSMRSRPLARFRHLHGDSVIKRGAQTASDAVSAVNDSGQTITGCFHVIVVSDCW